MPHMTGVRRPDRKKSSYSARGAALPPINIAAVLPEQKALWFKAAQAAGVSFSCMAREALDRTALEILRDGKPILAGQATKGAEASL